MRESKSVRPDARQKGEWFWPIGTTCGGIVERGHPARSATKPQARSDRKRTWIRLQQRTRSNAVQERTRSNAAQQRTRTNAAPERAGCPRSV